MRMAKQIVIGTIACGFTALAGLTACGSDGLPSGAAAQVGTTVIPRSSIGHVMVGRVAISRSAANKPSYWPSDVSGCVKSEQRRDAGQAPARLRAECKRKRKRAEISAVRLLIQGRWYELDARARGVKSSEKTLTLARASRHSGVSQADLRDATRIYFLRIVLTRNLLAKAAAVPQSEIDQYFKDHRERFAAPAQYTIDAMAARDRPRAEKAAAELRRGRSSAQAVRALHDRGVTVIPDGVGSTDDRKAIRQKASTLKRGDVAVVRISQGWVAFSLAAISPAHSMSRDEAAPEITNELVAKRQAQALKAYRLELRDRYSGQTTCAGEYEDVVPECQS
jgi:rhodanese-related sulfurtransferase